MRITGTGRPQITGLEQHGDRRGRADRQCVFCFTIVWRLGGCWYFPHGVYFCLQSSLLGFHLLELKVEAVVLECEYGGDDQGQEGSCSRDMNEERRSQFAQAAPWLA